MAKSLLTSTRSALDGNFHYYTLPKGLLTLSLWQMDFSDQPHFELRPELNIVPDPALRYYLQYNTPGNSHNTVKVTFGEKGYLSAIEVVREDKTLEIIENVIQSIKDAVVPLGPTDKNIGGDEPVEIYKTTIDPLDYQDVSRVSAIMKQLVPDLSIHFGLLESTDLEAITGADGKETGEQKMVFPAPPNNGNGFFARAMTMGRLTYSLSGSVKEELYTLPHPTPHLIQVPFAPFVKNTLKLTFGEYGQPNAIDLDQPSWMEKASKFPGKLISGIVDIPAQLIRLRINFDNSQQAVKSQYEAHKKTKIVTTEEKTD
ncbi:MAG: hypothetical protein AB8F95_20415 [Bacteroidia bacterium]